MNNGENFCNLRHTNSNVPLAALYFIEIDARISGERQENECEPWFSAERNESSIWRVQREGPKNNAEVGKVGMTNLKFVTVTDSRLFNAEEIILLV